MRFAYTKKFEPVARRRPDAPGRRRVARRRPLALRSSGQRIVGAAQDDEFDAAILRPALERVAVADRARLAVAVRAQAIGGHAPLDEILLDRGGAILGEPEVVVVVAALVGVPLDLDD